MFSLILLLTLPDHIFLDYAGVDPFEGSPYPLAVQTDLFSLSEEYASDGCSVCSQGSQVEGWSPKGGGARAEVNICRMLKRADCKLLLCHSSSFLPFSSFPVCNCGQVLPTYFIESLDLEWAVSLKIVWSKLPPIAIILR